MNRLLIVDDEAEILELLRMFFAGHEVQVAQNADRALEILRQREIDLMITDVRMPGRSGLDLVDDCHRLKPELPIIVITGHFFKAPEGRHPAVARWVQKPFRRQMIIDAVDEVLKRKRGGGP